MLLARKKRASDRSSTPGDTPDNKGKVSRENDVKTSSVSLVLCLKPICKLIREKLHVALNNTVFATIDFLYDHLLWSVTTRTLHFGWMFVPYLFVGVVCLVTPKQTSICRTWLLVGEDFWNFSLKGPHGDQMRLWKEHFEVAVNVIFSVWRRKMWGNPGGDLFCWRLVRERKTPAGIWWDSPAETEEYFSKTIFSSNFIWRSASGLVFRKRPAHSTQENVLLDWRLQTCQASDFFLGHGKLKQDSCPIAKLVKVLIKYLVWSNSL